jgi:hypothetical protein
MPPSAFNLPPGSFGNYSGVDFNNPMYKFPDPGSVKFDPSVYTDTGLAGRSGSFPSIDGSAAGQAAFGGAAPGGGLSWGAVQGLGNLANMGIQAFGDQQGTKAGQDYLDFMADMRDATFGSDLFERNKYITDSFRIPLIVGNLRTNNPELRAENRTMNLGNLAGKFLDQRFGGFLNT